MDYSIIRITNYTALACSFVTWFSNNLTSWVLVLKISELLLFTRPCQQAQGPRRESYLRKPFLRALGYSLSLSLSLSPPLPLCLSLLTYCDGDSRNPSFKFPSCSLKFFRLLKKRFERRGGGGLKGACNYEGARQQNSSFFEGLASYFFYK